MHPKPKPIALAMGVATAMTGMAQADTMVFTAWGGSTQDAEYKSWGAPPAAETGANVVMDGPTDYGKLQAMVDSGNVAWDVVDVEFDFAYTPPRLACWSRWISRSSTATQSIRVLSPTMLSVPFRSALYWATIRTS
ncbi:hypothetical protein [Roseovarius sp. Pro17]|uniref:hypothetical protein n=1 Tax=Roseovarius sp. Pro17 TaxID=3108175 RepID=UPI002D799CAB|nr:hypothetical protein [Roseovarius sp. Pro17]